MLCAIYWQKYRHKSVLWIFMFIWYSFSEGPLRQKVSWEKCVYKDCVLYKRFPINPLNCLTSGTKRVFFFKCQVYIKTLHSIHINKVSLCDMYLFYFQSLILTGNIDTWPFICVSFSFVLDLTVYFMENDKNMCSNIQQRPFFMSDWQPGLVVAVCCGEHTLRYSSICTTCSTGGFFLLFLEKNNVQSFTRLPL